MIFKSDMKVAEALEKIRNDVPQTPEVAQFLEFIEKSERGALR